MWPVHISFRKSRETKAQREQWRREPLEESAREMDEAQHRCY